MRPWAQHFAYKLLLARHLHNMFQIDNSTSSLTSEKSFEDFLMYYELARRECYQECEVRLEHFYAGCLTKDEQLYAFPPACIKWPFAYPAVGQEQYTRSDFVRPRNVSNVAIDCTSFTVLQGADEPIPIHQQMKCSKIADKSAADLVQAMAEQHEKHSPRNTRAIYVLHTLRAGKPKKDLPPGSVFMNSMSYDVYLRPLGPRMQVAWKHAGLFGESNEEK